MSSPEDASIFRKGQTQKLAAPPPRTPFVWRLILGGGVLVLGLLAFLLQPTIGPRGQAAIGILCFLGLAAAFSHNLRAVNWHTLGWGLAFQLLLALFVLTSEPGYVLFSGLAEGVKQFLEFTNEGSRVVFGTIANDDAAKEIFGKRYKFGFAFTALPTIIFVSSFFTILYYFGVLQFIVRVMARVMMFFMRTSGAETLSSSANVRRHSSAGRWGVSVQPGHASSNASSFSRNGSSSQPFNMGSSLDHSSAWPSLRAWKHTNVRKVSPGSSCARSPSSTRFASSM